MENCLRVDNKGIKTAVSLQKFSYVVIAFIVIFEYILPAVLPLFCFFFLHVKTQLIDFFFKGLGFRRV